MVEVGRGNPFEPVSDQRFTLEAGRQGGYHVDLSFRIRGAVDPDSVDVELRLRGDWQVSIHVDTDWILYLGPDGAYCDYLQARMVMLDEEGGLLQEDRFDQIVGRPLRLDMALQSAQGDIRDDFEIQVQAPPLE